MKTRINRTDDAPALLLFDIDLTLLSSHAGGMQALVEAGRELFHGGFTAEGVDFAGRLDPVIIESLLHRNSVAPTRESRAALREGYARHLERRLAVRPATTLAGVMELIGALHVLDHVVLGLLTGNFERTGCMKLRSAGVDPSWFSVAAWGDESPHDPPLREHLVPIAVGRYRERVGLAPRPSYVTIIGDTPHDVACAKAHGCRCLGVATGYSPASVLRAAGADEVVDDLSDTARVMRWLLQQECEPR